jgi:hypothetical protein
MTMYNITHVPEPQVKELEDKLTEQYKKWYEDVNNEVKYLIVLDEGEPIP